MPSRATRRLFFALWPDAAERAALADAVRKAVRGCGGRPVPEANLHLTLAFLGAVLEARVPDLCTIAGRIAGAFPRVAVPLVLTLPGLTHWDASQVLVVLAHETAGEATSGSVRALAGALASEASAAGFDPDLKPFRAHVTVARKVTRAPRASATRPIAWRFAQFALVESRTLASGPVYSVVESFVLGSAEKLRAEE